jgi:predicted AlkP superfamily pyrophosphatase or phosphodiesterase
MRVPAALFAVILSLATAAAASAAPVLMISVDGLRPGDVLDAQSRGVKDPVLQAIAREGIYATGVRDALPSVTYPNHTTLVTGVWPARHGIAANTTFDPLQKNYEGWYWYAPDIRVPTLWDAVHAAGRTVASLGWPVTADARSIDDDVPEYWRAKTVDDQKLVHALSTPGLPEAIAARAQVSLADVAPTTPEADEAKARAAAAIIALKHPAFFTLHLSSLDHEQHLHGPGSPEALAALARIDAAIGALLTAARRDEPDLIVAIVSDHGFAPVQYDVNLGAAFVQAGLIRLNDAGRPVAWDAAPWISGGSAAVVLARRDDPVLRAKVAGLLDRLAADPASGVGRVIARPEITAMGGAPDADFFVDARIGYEFSSKLAGPLVTPGTQKGTHGYFPEHPEMRAALLIAGPGLAAHGALGEVDMRDIAPTVAKLLGVGLPSADGRSLF